MLRKTILTAFKVSNKICHIEVIGSRVYSFTSKFSTYKFFNGLNTKNSIRHYHGTHYLSKRKGGATAFEIKENRPFSKKQKKRRLQETIRSKEKVDQGKKKILKNQQEAKAEAEYPRMFDELQNLKEELSTGVNESLIPTGIYNRLQKLVTDTETKKILVDPMETLQFLASMKSKIEMSKDQLLSSNSVASLPSNSSGSNGSGSGSGSGSDISHRITIGSHNANALHLQSDNDTQSTGATLSTNIMNFDQLNTEQWRQLILSQDTYTETQLYMLSDQGASQAIIDFLIGKQINHVNHMLQLMQDLSLRVTIDVYDTRLKLAFRQGDYNQVEKIFNEVMNIDITPSNDTWALYTHAMMKMKGVQEGLNILKRLEKLQVQLDIKIYNAILEEMITQQYQHPLRVLDGVDEFFADMHGIKNVKPSTESFNIYLKHLRYQGRVERAFMVMDEMETLEVDVNETTIVQFLACCEHAPFYMKGYGDTLFDAIQIIEKLQILPTTRIYEAIIKAFAKYRDTAAAEYYFWEMDLKGIPKRESTYTALLLAYAHANRVGAPNVGVTGRYVRPPDAPLDEYGEAAVALGEKRFSELLSESFYGDDTPKDRGKERIRRQLDMHDMLDDMDDPEEYFKEKVIYEAKRLKLLKNNKTHADLFLSNRSYMDPKLSMTESYTQYLKANKAQQELLLKEAEEIDRKEREKDPNWILQQTIDPNLKFINPFLLQTISDKEKQYMLLSTPDVDHLTKPLSPLQLSNHDGNDNSSTNNSSSTSTEHSVDSNSNINDDDTNLLEVGSNDQVSNIHTNTHTHVSTTTTTTTTKDTKFTTDKVNIEEEEIHIDRNDKEIDDIDIDIDGFDYNDPNTLHHQLEALLQDPEKAKELQRLIETDDDSQEMELLLKEFEENAILKNKKNSTGATSTASSSSSSNSSSNSSSSSSSSSSYKNMTETDNRQSKSQHPTMKSSSYTSNTINTATSSTTTNTADTTTTSTTTKDDTTTTTTTTKTNDLSLEMILDQLNTGELDINNLDQSMVEQLLAMINNQMDSTTTTPTTSQDSHGTSTATNSGSRDSSSVDISNSNSNNKEHRQDILDTYEEFDNELEKDNSSSSTMNTQRSKKVETEIQTSSPEDEVDLTIENMDQWNKVKYELFDVPPIHPVDSDLFVDPYMNYRNERRKVDGYHPIHYNPPTEIGQQLIDLVDVVRPTIDLSTDGKSIPLYPSNTRKQNEVKNIQLQVNEEQIKQSITKLNEQSLNGNNDNMMNSTSNIDTTDQTERIYHQIQGYDTNQVSLTQEDFKALITKIQPQDINYLWDRLLYGRPPDPDYSEPWETKRFKNITRADMIFQEIQLNGYIPSHLTLYAYLAVYTHAGLEEKALQIFAYYERLNIIPKVKVYASLIQMYMMFDRIDKIMEIKEKMIINNIIPDTMLYSKLIDYYTDKDMIVEALLEVEDAAKNKVKVLDRYVFDLRKKLKELNVTHPDLTYNDNKWIENVRETRNRTKHTKSNTRIAGKMKNLLRVKS